MKKAILVLLALSLVCPVSQSKAQGKKPVAQAKAGATEKLNPQIQKILRELSAANIEATIRKLVSFHTRHSLSETESDTRGIGAARRWIKSDAWLTGVPSPVRVPPPRWMNGEFTTAQRQPASRTAKERSRSYP